MKNIINNPLYLKRMASLIREFMEKKYDIMHLANGDFIVATANTASAITVVSSYTTI